MLSKTHLAIGMFTVFLFLEHVNNKLVFIPVLLIASLLPDIDSAFSTVGRRRIFRLVQIFTKHRGIIHSFTFCILVSSLFAYYLPVVAFPFFLGYSLHLLADSWTIEGIKPFWPMKRTVKGKVSVGGPLEETVFFIFVVVDLLLLILLFI